MREEVRQLMCLLTRSEPASLGGLVLRTDAGVGGSDAGSTRVEGIEDYVAHSQQVS